MYQFLFAKKLYIIIDISERKKVTSLISMGTMWFREHNFRRVSVLLLWRDFVFFCDFERDITG